MNGKKLPCVEEKRNSMHSGDRVPNDLLKTASLEEISGWLAHYKAELRNICMLTTLFIPYSLLAFKLSVHCSRSWIENTDFTVLKYVCSGWVHGNNIITTLCKQKELVNSVLLEFLRE